MDEMLHLVHQIRAPVNKYTLVGVRQLFYNDFADIQVQLGLTARAWTQVTPPHIEVPEREEPQWRNRGSGGYSRS